ncbi:MAG: lipid-A-disaccharide synthase [Desulfuromonadales bacterium]
MNKIVSDKQIMIVTGEASGDLHGARLIEAIRARDSRARFIGVGGRSMAAAGCEILIQGETLAVMGIVEVLGHFPVLWRAFQQLKRRLTAAERPDVLVLIDFPEFNLRLARQAKKAGVPVLYYVSPQVWAWRRGRVKKIAAVVDALAAIFPFEPELYHDQDIMVRYVGHPLLDEFAHYEASRPPHEEAQETDDRTLVGLFPGSRRNELEAMLETLIATAQRIRQARPEVHFLVPIAGTLKEQEVVSRFPADLPVTFVDTSRTSIYDVASRCAAIVTVSGTVTLQIALTATPMVIAYKLSPLSYAIGKRLIRVAHIGLANIVAGRRVVPEFIQEAATTEALSEEILRMLADRDYAEEIRSGLLSVRARLGEPGCSDRVAEMVLDLVADQKTMRTAI